jgi:hypothetical protein
LPAAAHPLRNSLLDLCQNKIDEKMEEVCGSTTDCNKFSSDDTMGTGSLQSQKVGDVYRVTGMLSFGMIKMGNGTECDGTDEDGDCDKENILPAGRIGVQDYIKYVKQKNGGVPNKDGIIANIESELNNLAGTINRTIDIIESDPQIQFCLEGRDLSQINGQGSKKNNKTTARYPNLLNNQKMLISASALRQAQDNYNKKFNKMVAEATKNASADLAQYMCQMMAQTGGGSGMSQADTPLAPPYAISYDVGSGLTKEDLLKGGTGVTNTGGGAKSGGSVNVLVFGSGGSSSADGGVYRERTAVFSRESRNCHFCTMTTTKSCTSSGGTGGFLGIGAKSSSSSCTMSDPIENCTDIEM